MLNQPASTTRQLGRYLLAAPLVMALALACSCAQRADSPVPITAQITPTAGTTLLVYVDGHPVATALTNLDPKMIVAVSVLKDEQARRFAPEAASRGVVFVTTKLGQTQPEVVAFNKRITQLSTSADEVALQAIAHKEQVLNTAQYYVNGQLSNKLAVEALDPKQIVSVAVLKDKQAADFVHDATVQSVVQVTTK